MLPPERGVSPALVRARVVCPNAGGSPLPVPETWGRKLLLPAGEGRTESAISGGRLPGVGGALAVAVGDKEACLSGRDGADGGRMLAAARLSFITPPRSPWIHHVRINVPLAPPPAPPRVRVATALALLIRRHFPPGGREPRFPASV